ncbi:hypothetical protein QR680_008122 [Steinernema hermaphroditum]|uniref:UPAR/Ly6 domain-containing protein n=1 Tax=Steinernema hermaphroditum TaxID=289476 RepID=A0AA39M7A7_9BILA|nr:hypothetical protein QR680_008122 [Steinernema hermaphroditum]
MRIALLATVVGVIFCVAYCPNADAAKPFFRVEWTDKRRRCYEGQKRDGFTVHKEMICDHQQFCRYEIEDDREDFGCAHQCKQNSEYDEWFMRGGKMVHKYSMCCDTDLCNSSSTASFFAVGAAVLLAAFSP